MCAAGRSSKKLLKLREDGEVLNGAKDQAVPAEADLEAQTVQSGTKKGMILPFIRLAITFRDIHYYVPMPEVRHVILPRGSLPICPAKRIASSLCIVCRSSDTCG